MGRKAKEDKRFQARAIEIVFDEHIDGKLILDTYKQNLKVGLYCGFVKWHNGTEDEPNEHTHVAIVTREKPKWEFHKLKKIFKVGEVEPHLVNPIGKGNGSPKKKLTIYCNYMTDGHDNGHFEDTWNYKFDLELESCKPDGRILCLLGRGKSIKEIVQDGDWDFRAYVMKNKSSVDKMVNNWRKFNEDQTVYYSLDEFKPKVLTALEDSGWNPKKQTLILKGPSNAGKTELAKAALKKLTGQNPLFCRNLNKLAHQEPGQPIIMDDMNFSQIHRTKAIALTDIENDSDIRILFGIHTIDAGTAQIFTTNEEYEDYLPYDTTDVIRRRVCWVDLTKFGRLY